jgi:hypothetical protein
MAEFYYSTQPFLAWVFNTYFFSNKHYAWVAQPFYPYKRKNPRSSSPLRLYEDIYEMWLDRDQFSCLLPHYRAGIRKGVFYNIQSTDSLRAMQLYRICDNIGIEFFCPVVYRMDLYPAKNDTKKERYLDDSQGSAKLGSQEYLIKDLLLACKFDMLFWDFENEESLKQNHSSYPNNSYQDHMIMLRDRRWSKQTVYNILRGYSL